MSTGIIKFNRLLISIIVILLVPTCYAQVISIEEYLNSAMADKQSGLKYSKDFDGNYYSTFVTREYVAIREQSLYPKNVDKGQMENIYKPHKISFLSGENKLAELDLNGENYMVKGVIKSEDEDLFIYTSRVDGKYCSSIRKLDGSLISILNCPPFVTCSPGGVYYYNSRANDGLSIYDEYGNFIFAIPCIGSYSAKAVSDSLILVLDANSLSMWDISYKSVIWKTEIPSPSFKLSGNSIIKFSLLHNIIAVNGLYGCYCFDFNGNFLWQKEYDSNQERLQMLGISSFSGELVTIRQDYNLKNSIIEFFTVDGKLRTNKKMNWINSQNAFREWDKDLLIFEDIIMVPCISGNYNTRDYYTSIITFENDEPQITNIAGFWYFLESKTGETHIVGFSPDDNKIKSFKIVL